MIVHKQVLSGFGKQSYQLPRGARVCHFAHIGTAMEGIYVWHLFEVKP